MFFMKKEKKNKYNRPKKQEMVHNISGYNIPGWKKIVFTVIIICMAMVVIEGAVRLLILVSSKQRYNINAANVMIETDWLNILNRDIRGAGNASELYVPDAKVFWRLRPVITVELENRVYKMNDEPIRWTVKINADGYRGVRYPQAGSGARPVIIVIGDSVTFGFRVQENETYAAQLQEYLNNHGLNDAVVVNYGVPGYTSFQGKRILEEILLKHKPDIIIAAFGANDIERDRLSDYEKAKKLTPEKIRFNQFYNSLLITRLIRSIRGRVRYIPDKSGNQAVRVPLPEYLENMISIISTAKEIEAEVILLDLVFVGDFVQQKIAEVARMKNVPWLNGRRILMEGLRKIVSGRRFQKEKWRMDVFWDKHLKYYRRLYYGPDFYEKLFKDPVQSNMLRYLMIEPVHPSPLGHRIIAEEVGNLILSLQKDKSSRETKKD